MIRYDCIAPALAAAVLLLVGARAPAADRPPNVILVLADDLGWADLGCYGNKFNETPRIDKLATQGLRFTDCYAYPVCSPTRAAIQTGQDPARLGLTAHIPGHWRPFEKLAEPPCALDLPRGVATVAERLRAAGYATGYFGKWHLGSPGPHGRGYDETFEFTGHVVPGPRLEPPTLQPRRAAEYLAERAVKFIAAHRDRPFFLQVSPFAVHIPLSTTPALEAKYAAKPKTPGYASNALYAGLLEELDTGVGAILDALDKSGLSANTLFIFLSDNGGLEREVGGWPGTTNAPLRNEKGTLYEGGIRVPMIVRWPGATKPGTVTSVPAFAADFFPTALAAAHAPRSDQTLDGVSLLPMLRDPGAALPREALYWHYPHYHHSRPSGAIRAGDWKAIEFFDTGALELYNLRGDLGESKDLAAAQPEQARDLRAKLHRWRLSVDAQMPQRNPAYDPKRAGEWWSRVTVAPTDAPGTYRPVAAKP